LRKFHENFQRWLFVIPVFATLSAWFCYSIGFTIELRALVTIFFAGVFFAFAVTMNTANVRRFQALDEIALIKSILLSLWQTAKTLLNEQQLEALQRELRQFFQLVQVFLYEEIETESSTDKLLEIDQFFEGIIKTGEDFRSSGMPSPEISRILQWHQQAYYAFEKLLTIKESRTPITLRLFIALSLILSLFVLAPQFAQFGYYGIFSAAIVSTILVVLIRIQDMLEHPFGEDPDDISFEFSERMEERIR
jgi:hypothetical protein|tara:strand:+ start:1075 stop:1824 length:750 start_codon:yes stop_codon:yes gene_type:complete